MINEMEFCVGKACENQVTEHLTRCDASFSPRLSSRVTIADYAKKLTEHALCLEAWHQGVIVGLVGVYCNDPEQGAFITNVSVLPGFQGIGVASELLRNAVEVAREIGFNNLRLEVDDSNVAALRLYQQFGFTPERITTQTTMMILNW